MSGRVGRKTLGTVERRGKESNDVDQEEGSAMTATQTPEQLARRRAKYLSDLMWHTGAFLIINALFWILDLVVGQQGIQWAFWITLFWGVALAFHTLAYLVAGRQLERRKAQQYLEKERGRGTEP
jgi:hypothetical protein